MRGRRKATRASHLISRIGVESVAVSAVRQVSLDSEPLIGQGADEQPHLPSCGATRTVSRPVGQAARRTPRLLQSHTSAPAHLTYPTALATVSFRAKRRTL